MIRASASFYGPGAIVRRRYFDIGQGRAVADLWPWAAAKPMLLKIQGVITPGPNELKFVAFPSHCD
jgi:hypothetical protein